LVDSDFLCVCYAEVVKTTGRDRLIFDFFSRHFGFDLNISNCKIKPLTHYVLFLLDRNGIHVILEFSKNSLPNSCMHEPMAFSTWSQDLSRKF